MSHFKTSVGVHPKHDNDADAHKESINKARFSQNSITSDDGSDEVDLLDEIQLIFAREPVIEEEASGKTVLAADKEIEELERTDHLFMNPFEPDSDALSATIPTNEHSRIVSSYVIERQDGIRMFFVNQVDVLFYDRGRMPIMYELFSKQKHLLMIVDGRESTCGSMEVTIKGAREGMVRGNVKAMGLCRFQVTDLYNDNVYIISIPCWVAIFTCFLFCFSPCFRIMRKSPRHRQHTKQKKSRDEEVIAELGCKKWKDTFFKSDDVFCLHFLNKELEPHYKVFLFAVSLAFYHIYFKRPGKALRCLLFYGLMMLILILLGILVFCLVLRFAS